MNIRLIVLTFYLFAICLSSHHAQTLGKSSGLDHPRQRRKTVTQNVFPD
jgi:hypothetical protein